MSTEILTILFPFKLHMTVLQLEGYNYLRFLTWLTNNFYKRQLPIKRSLQPTFKVYLIYAMSFVWLILIFTLSLVLTNNFFFSLLILLIVLSQPYLLYGISLIALKPIEYYLKERIKTKTRVKISSFKNLKVIGITGSYGKSSTKEILYQLLKDDFEVLKTPESYNTILGISKVVDLELNSRYQFFICEMGAFKRGEIKEICDTVSPDYGLITGITQQHLERFGSIKNIVKAKFELLDSIHNVDHLVFNLDNKYVEGELLKRGISKVFAYGVRPECQVKMSKKSFSKKGSQFTLTINRRAFRISTQLFGESNIQNIASAAAMATLLGLRPETIASKISKLRPIPHRFFLQSFGQATIVDNTYSTNPSGFREMLKTAQSLKGKKVLVTPGLVELGEKEMKVHKELGKLSENIFEKIVLVGKNTRTKYFAQSISMKSKIEFIADERVTYSNKIKELIPLFDWIFLENDVTENY